MGPSVKFVLAIIDSISKKKMGVNFFSAKLGPRASCLWTQKIPILIFEYFPKQRYCVFVVLLYDTFVISKYTWVISEQICVS